MLRLEQTRSSCTTGAIATGLTRLPPGEDLNPGVFNWNPT